MLSSNHYLNALCIKQTTNSVQTLEISMNANLFTESLNECLTPAWIHTFSKHNKQKLTTGATTEEAWAWALNN